METKTYSNKSNACRAAKKDLGAHVVLGEDFDIQDVSEENVKRFKYIILSKVQKSPKLKKQNIVENTAHGAEEETQAPSHPVMSFMLQQLDNDLLGRSREEKTQERQVNPNRVSTAGVKVEKNRPVQNGVKRPSEGTVCRAIWDELDKHAGIDSKGVRALAIKNEWNLNNASIEFYQWRKFNKVKK
jgi:hypothetical protein